jgi:hypothetical protein
VHVEGCLSRRYIAIAGGLVKMTFIPAPGKAKGYHPKSLLSFMPKTMQKLVARHIWKESLGYVPYSYTSLYTNQTSLQQPQCTIITHIQEGVENR